jgi:hypothetical protein
MGGCEDDYHDGNVQKSQHDFFSKEEHNNIHRH